MNVARLTLYLGVYTAGVLTLFVVLVGIGVIPI